MCLLFGYIYIYTYIYNIHIYIYTYIYYIGTTLGKPDIGINHISDFVYMYLCVCISTNENKLNQLNKQPSNKLYVHLYIFIESYKQFNRYVKEKVIYFYESLSVTHMMYSLLTNNTKKRSPHIAPIVSFVCISLLTNHTKEDTVVLFVKGRKGVLEVRS